MEYRRSLIVILLIYIVCDGKETVATRNNTYKPCLGTEAGLSTSGDSDRRYRTYVSKYTNCTFIDGNLEIAYLQKDYDMSFLNTIEEVSGYVLIVSNHFNELPLTKLRVIRGKTLYKHGEKGSEEYYSLYVALNFNPHTGNGLRELSFYSLYEIMVGSVMFYDNKFMCFENTIHWQDILLGEGSNVEFHLNSTSRCNESCDNACTTDFGKHCWGAGPNKCQTLTSLICSPQCDRSCFNTTPNDCCHAECVGGCSGPRSSDCYACKNFRNEGECVNDCPKRKRYNPATYTWEDNPKGKYSYGGECVDMCPEYMVADDEACVRDCGSGKVQSEDSKKCVPCDGVCPKECPGTTFFGDLNFINSQNIGNFSNCTRIKGGLSIMAMTFNGDAFNNISGLHPRALSVFETVEEITGFLHVQGYHPDFVDLSMFRNLRSIKGRILSLTRTSLFIQNTTIRELGLNSLKNIDAGRVLIQKNKNLCLIPTLTFRQEIVKSGYFLARLNGNDTVCDQRGTCDPECSNKGCWGQGNRQCVECKNYSYQGQCIGSCNDLPRVFLGHNSTCEPCHEQCRNRCTGQGADLCDECKNVKDGPYCVAECPISKYPDNNSTCLPCHEACVEGCTGPRNAVGRGACNECYLRVMKEVLPDIPTNNDVEKCLPELSGCEDGYFLQNAKIYDPMTNKTEIKSVCKKCDSKCKTCVHSSHICIDCVHYKQNTDCVNNCSSGYYPVNREGICLKCHESCKLCKGPALSDCLACNDFTHYLNATKEQFVCVDKCPSDVPLNIREETIYGAEFRCVSKAEHDKVTGVSSSKLSMGSIGGIVAAIVIIAVVLVVLLCYIRHQRKDSRLREFTMRMMSQEESEPLTPTKAKPDMAMLRLIKESELRKGNIIGSGAFGTVYKGVWIPAGENVKIPVAIKVLQEGTPNQNKELLEEARIMTSVDHICCIRILAVCMTAQMMLITQLMPLGCLLDYVRKNKSNIGSKVLLNWCTQIAKGMSYLEEHGIVHRDLAARNVLVQSSTQVRITDFGLAKLLDYNEGEFHAAGGKMPIKWLALECIHNKVFTPKSDVWSFGVTIWELFTFGQRPYESVRARDIPDLLEKGERLPQPSICTIDVYMIMIKCWMLDAESRPSFKELEDEFAKMARDPGRYLVIQGDKLLRLPSHTYDTKDLVRNMSVVADGPEEIIEADEYLQPQQFSLNNKIPPPNIMPSLAPPNYKLDKVNEDNNYDDSRNAASHTTPLIERPVEPNPNPTPIREQKYSGLESAAAARLERQQKEPPSGRDSISTRYSTDPCKVIALGGPIPDDVPNMPAPPTPLGIPTQKDKMGGALRLPVDEDDYLQPKSSNPVSYMDLVGDNPDYLGSDRAEGGVMDASYLDMKAGNAMDNPEYFDTNRNVGMPGVAFAPNLSEKSPLTQNTSADLRLPSSDYYNEFENFNQTAKPRTESTV